MHAYLLSLLEETPLEVTQDGRNQATNNLVASVKYLLVLATPLAVGLIVFLLNTFNSRRSEYRGNQAPPSLKLPKGAKSG